MIRRLCVDSRDPSIATSEKASLWKIDAPLETQACPQPRQTLECAPSAYTWTKRPLAGRLDFLVPRYTFIRSRFNEIDALRSFTAHWLRLKDLSVPWSKWIKSRSLFHTHKWCISSCTRGCCFFLLCFKSKLRYEFSPRFNAHAHALQTRAPSTRTAHDTKLALHVRPQGMTPYIMFVVSIGFFGLDAGRA